MWSLPSRRCAVLALGLTCFFALAGCGQSRYDVTGKVTYNGEVLKKSGGIIVFVGSDGVQTTANIDDDGTYRATSVVAGANRVAVYYPNPAGKVDKSRKLKPGETPPPKVPVFLTPEKYAAVDSSGFVVTVAQGVVFNAEMTGPPIK